MWSWKCYYVQMEFSRKCLFTTDYLSSSKHYMSSSGVQTMLCPLSLQSVLSSNFLERKHQRLGPKGYHHLTTVSNV